MSKIKTLFSDIKKAFSKAFGNEQQEEVPVVPPTIMREIEFYTTDEAAEVVDKLKNIQNHCELYYIKNNGRPPALKKPEKTLIQTPIHAKSMFGKAAKGEIFIVKGYK